MAVTDKKSKKAMESINSKLALVMKSGKYHFGYKQTLKALRLVSIWLLIISDNILIGFLISGKSKIGHYCQQYTLVAKK